MVTAIAEPPHLETDLKTLCLSTVATQWRPLAEQASRQRQAPADYLAQLVHLEVTGRRERRIQRRIQDARFPMLKTLDAFSFDAQPDLDRDAVLHVFDCRFVADAANVVFVGGVGTGKTHLSIALGMACCQHVPGAVRDRPAGPLLAKQQHDCNASRPVPATAVILDERATCRSTGRRPAVRLHQPALRALEPRGDDELVTLLVEAQQQGRLQRKLDQLARYDAVILDELGYVPFDKAGADLLFAGFISQRYERWSLVVTTNLPFARWAEVFLDATAAAAVIDRIVHHATVLTTAGDSSGSKPPHATRRPARQRRCHGNSAHRDVASRRSAPSGHVATLTTTTQEWGSHLHVATKVPFSVAISKVRASRSGRWARRGRARRWRPVRRRWDRASWRARGRRGCGGHRRPRRDGGCGRRWWRSPGRPAWRPPARRGSSAGCGRAGPGRRSDASPAARAGARGGVGRCGGRSDVRELKRNSWARQPSSRPIQHPSSARLSPRRILVFMTMGSGNAGWRTENGQANRRQLSPTDRPPGASQAA